MAPLPRACPGANATSSLFSTSRLVAVASLFALVAGCGGGGGGDAPAPTPPAPAPTPPAPPPPAAFDAVLVKNCNGLKGQTVDASAIGTNSTQPGLATSGAAVADAVVVDAASGLPKYCKVTGTIAAATAGAPAISFQVNLPATWNAKALQYGGGGLNGSVVTGLNALPSAAPTDTVPLARGYITFGSDSGHASAASTDASFALNAEALTNFAYAQMKKTKDVALVLGARLYEQATAATPVYFVGSSEGGREALTVAQRFPDDYAGVIARVPVIQFTGLQLGGNRISTAIRQPGAWLNETKLLLVNSQSNATCDAQDGLTDGVIGKALSCQADPQLIRCPNGTDANNSCLSDAQIAGLNVIHTPLSLGFPLANGNTGYFRYQWGGESPAAPGGGLATWWYGTSAPSPAPGGLGDTLGDAFVKYFIAQDANFDPTTFNPTTYQARIQAVSALLDSDDPAALVAYMNKGGKVIVKEHGADYARSPFATVDYLQRVQTANATAAANGLRFYLNPSVDHGGVGVQPDSVDLLTQLENWVEKSQAPADALTVSRYDTTTNAVTKTRLMCRYPAYPHYNGTGDVDSASSFACSTP